VQTFEESVSRDFPDSLFQQSVKLQSIYQKAVPLRPGLYRLDLVIKDVQSGNIGVVNSRLAVPRYEDEKTRSQHADSRGSDRTRSRQADWLRTVCAWLFQGAPASGRRFQHHGQTRIYMQVYNFKSDEKTHKSSGASNTR